MAAEPPGDAPEHPIDPASRVTVLSGPSGVGKGTVVGIVRERYPDVWVSVSVTTRKPRPGEQEGVQYHFIDWPTYQKMIDDGDLLEHAVFAGNGYGTPWRPLRDRIEAGLPALLEIDLQGARQVRKALPAAQLVFLAPPSWPELVRRLVGRGTEDATAIARRLEAARVELGAGPEFDIMVVNDDIERAADELVRLIDSPARLPARPSGEYGPVES